MITSKVHKSWIFCRLNLCGEKYLSSFLCNLFIYIVFIVVNGTCFFSVDIFFCLSHKITFESWVAFLLLFLLRFMLYFRVNNFINPILFNFIICCSIFQVVAVYLTWRYRNQYDPYDLPARAVFPHRNYLYWKVLKWNFHKYGSFIHSSDLVFLFPNKAVIA